MKRKTLRAFLVMMLAGAAFNANAQNGLENIVIEKYYVANAADAANADAALAGAGYTTGTLPAGSVTYRIYADLAPGWALQTVYGEAGHPLVLTTSTNFFNHPNGDVNAGPLPSNNALIVGDGTTILDSYLAAGAAAAGRFAVTKDEDGAGGGANYTFSPAGVMANVDPSAGLAVSVADGIYNTAGAPALLATNFLGDAAGTPVAIFRDGSTVGGTFNSTNSVWGVLGDQQGAFPAGTNRVLIGQFTTSGVFTYALNLQIRNTTTFAIQKYVSKNPGSSEIFLSSLTGVVGSPTAYAIPSLSGVMTKAILTVGQTALNGYRLVGIPDGMGAYDNNDGTYTLLMSHELGNTAGITRAHGAKGSFMSKWVINKSTGIVEQGSDLIQDMFVWNGSAYVDSAYAIARMCSGDLPEASAFYNSLTGKGTTERIFMNGEETGAEGKAIAHIVSGPNAGKSYELPYLGKFSWENSVARPFLGDKTVVVGTDDATPGQVYVYIGTKTNSGLEIQKAGLTNGKLYGIKVNGLATESNASVPAPNTPFTMYDFGNVSGLTGAALNTASNANGVTNFLRPEDVVWDTKNPNIMYFVTTNSFTANSRLWKVQFTDVNNPELGGTITALLEGSEGQKMLDNMTMDNYGNIVMQEDPGNQTHIAKIWNYNLATDALTLLAEHDTAFFLTGGSKFLTQDEESSGIIDASSILGGGMYLFNVEAHYAIAGELVEGGQILSLFSPITYAAESKGPSTSQTPYVLPAKSGVITKAILTVGDTAANGYKMVGIPDGMGAYDNGNGSYTLLVNHELGNTAGVVRAHGAAGSFVSKWTINKADQAVIAGQDLIQDVFVNVAGTYVDSAYAIARLCSGDLPEVSAFYNAGSGNGTQNRIFMNGEETGAEGKAFAHIVTGTDAGKSYELPYLGKFSWENAIACPNVSDKTIVVGLDDATPGQVYVYIGTKQSTGNDIQKAGLTNGKLYGVKVSGMPLNNIEINGSFPASGSAFNLVDLGFVNNMTGATLQTNSVTAGVTQFLRPEDGHFDPNNLSDFYFVTTNSFSAPSRLWKLHFNNINNPELGGTVDVLLAGNEGQKMMDNMTIDSYGNILIQEDVGNNAHLGKIHNYNIATDVLETIATHDSVRFLTGGSQFLTQDEESSGIIEVPFLGAGMFLINDQAHYAIPGELVEGGQILSLYNPASAVNCVATSSTTTQSAVCTYTWNGATYTASGTYAYATLNAAGCDSIAYLNLTILPAPTWYADADGDGFGNAGSTTTACTQPVGYVANSSDCDDNSAAVNPNATEVCNGIDDDCDGLTDAADSFVAPLAPLGSISGTLVECKPFVAGTATFSVVPVQYATTYTWSVPTGLTIVSGQGTTSITVSWTTTSLDPTIKGNLSVVATNACGGSTSTSSYLEFAATAPVTPNSISGTARVCPGDVATYSVALVNRASTYNWTVPTGMTITAGAGTNVINVSVGAGFVGGNITVTASNICGNSPVRSRSTSLNLPNTPGVIGGAASGVCQSSGVVYTIASVPNATSYSWTVPAGATIAAGQGTAALTVDFGAGFTGGQITVASVNGCGTSSVRSFTVSGAPARPGAISGIVSPACGGQSYTYSVGSVAGTTNYLWTVTPGGSVAFPTPLIVNGKDAQITWTLGAPSSQGVNVRTQNACGTSTTRSASVTVNTCIRVADAIQAEIYPNPAHDLVNVVFAAESAANFQVQIIDAAGRVVAQESIAAVAGMNKMEVDVNGLASGMYTIMISSENSKLIEKLLID
jgi:hypothetical protein